MRIISGQFRGRRLLGPAGRTTTRPITDRVKTALFDRLEAAGLLEGADVLDLFAGTGSMGLEALSRGAAHVCFVERDRTALQRLRRNVEALGAAGSVRIVRDDALAATAAARPAGEGWTLLFVDPPYAMWEDVRARGRLVRQLGRLAGSAAPCARLLVRTERNVEVFATEGEAQGWYGERTDTWGMMQVHRYRIRPGQAEEAPPQA